MMFSRWRAAGNEYLLAERAELGRPLTADSVRAEVGGADGILEVVRVDGEEAEIVIWNPDGSVAELSGNGTRIAARWLAERTGATVVRIRVGPREVVARMIDDGLIEQELGNRLPFEKSLATGAVTVRATVVE
jgi:diaminopimelate epimerase